MLVPRRFQSRWDANIIPAVSLGFLSRFVLFLKFFVSIQDFWGVRQYSSTECGSNFFFLSSRNFGKAYIHMKKNSIINSYEIICKIFQPLCSHQWIAEQTTAVDTNLRNVQAVCYLWPAHNACMTIPLGQMGRCHASIYSRSRRRFFSLISQFE